MNEQISQLSLLCSNLFSFETFPFKAVFHNKQHPWEVLKFLPDYLKAFGDSNFNLVDTKAYPQVHFKNAESIYLADGVVIEPGAFISGPTAIGRGSVIRHAAYIRGDTLIGENCIVGHCTEIKGSIFLNGSKASHFAYIGNSILGEGVNLGAGTRLANLRLDKKEVTIQVGSDKVATGLKKMGALLGDGVQVGCNSVANPGAVMKKGALALPLSNIVGFFPKIIK